MPLTNEDLRWIWDFKHGKLAMGQSTFCPELDQYYLFKENEFTVWLGHDGSGKSTIVPYLLALRSKFAGDKHILYMAENKPRTVAKNLIQFYFCKHVTDLEKSELREGWDWVNEHFLFLESGPNTVEDVLRLATENYNNHNNLIIDPYNSLDGDDSFAYHRNCISRIRDWSKDLCSTHVLHHPATERYLVNDKSHPYAPGLETPPRASSASGGNIWRQRCDNFIVTHRYRQHEERWMLNELHVYKIKEEDTGGRATIKDEPVLFRMLKGGVGFVQGEIESGYNPMTKQEGISWN